MTDSRTPPHRLSADGQSVAWQHKSAWGWLQLRERAVGVLGEDDRWKIIIERFFVLFLKA